MPDILCVDHEAIDELPSVPAIVIYHGNSLCEEHYERRFESNRQATREFEQRMAEIERENREHAD